MTERPVRMVRTRRRKYSPTSGIHLLLAFIGIVVSMSAKVVDALRTVNMLQLAWLSDGGEPVNNQDAATSVYIVPLAVKHFNDRYDAIVPAIASTRSCDVRISMMGGMRDDTGVSSTAMLQFVGGSNFRNVSIIQGPIRSDVAQPIGVTAGALKIPQISHSSSSESLSNKLVYPLFFRTISSDAQRAESIAALYKQFGYKKVGMIYVNDAFGVAWKNSLFLECEKRKIRLISVLFDAGARGDELQDQVTKALRVLVLEKIRVISHISLTLDFVMALARAAHSLDWIDDRLYVSHVTYAKDAVQNSDDPALLMKFLNGSLTVLAGVDENPNWKNLREAWPSINVTEINALLPNGTMGNGNSYKLPPDYFQRGQENIRYRSWALAYDSVIAIGLAACGPSPVLAENLAKLEFYGTSGQVRFASNYNRDPSTVLFVLMNTISGVAQPPYDQVKAVEVGRVGSTGNWSLTMDIMFSDGSNIPPIDVEPPVHVIDSIPLGAQIFGWVEAFVSVVAAFGALIYVYRHRKDQVIIESQPIFMALLASGCIILASSIIPLTFEDDIGCMMFPWLFATGFTLSLSALTAKSVRVAILWYHRGPIVKRNKSARAQVLMMGIVVVMAIEIAILISWQVLAPLQFATITSQHDADGNPLYSASICTSSDPLTTVLFALLVVYVCLVVFGTMWVSFWVRNAPEKYQEAKMTAVAGVCMFQVFFVGLPAAAAVWGMALPRFLVLSSITFLLCMIILVTMFMPKIFKSSFSGMNSTPPNSLNNQGSPELTGNEETRTRQSKRIRSDVQAVRSNGEMQKTTDVEAAMSQPGSLIGNENRRSQHDQSSSVVPVNEEPSAHAIMARNFEVDQLPIQDSVGLALDNLPIADDLALSDRVKTPNGNGQAASPHTNANVLSLQ